MEAKKIIITGSATRIGSAIAKSLAGYDIEITIHFNKSKNLAKKLKAELEEAGSKVYLIKADLNNLKQVNKIVPFAYKKMRGLDCLINNASVFEKDDLINFTEKSFTRHMNVNLKAAAVLIKDFKKFIKFKKGNVINIIDQRIKKLTPFFFSYTLSKAALATLTETTAMKLAPDIRVNGISPGPTIKNKRQSEKHFKAQWKSTILKKQVDINNICKTVKFLIENDNITGQIISVDSGQSLAWKTPDIINAKE
mgnify:CR=1 FL=1|tara:strand:- start:288 stop:1043 length:756 start_codon:yes stop_codon:yes gene_type:complete